MDNDNALVVNGLASPTEGKNEDLSPSELIIYDFPPDLRTKIK